jgi:lipooligosaccharide transport system ATP-binding protein
MAAIEVEGLVKRYGRVQALRGVGFAVEPGEVFGLLGPNGAGKTTTLRILAGLVRPDRGAARLLGRPCGPARSRLPLGYLPGEPRPDGDLSGAALLGLLEGLHPGRGAPQRGALAAALGLTGAETSRRLKTLSHGTRQKVALVAALQHDPEVIVLDEPTTGLDPAVRLSLWQRVRALRAGGTTVLLTTHYMDEAERLCDRLAILAQGRVAAEGAPAELIRRHLAPEALELELPQTEEGPLLDGLRGVKRLRAGTRLVLYAADAPALVDVLRARRLEGRLVAVRPTNLEDVFLALTGTRLEVAA